MDDYELEDLRRKVKAKKNKEEAQKLKMQLYGQDNIDKDAIYLSCKEAMSVLNVSRNTIFAMVKDGRLPNSVKIKSYKSHRWVIHPKDIEAIKDMYT